MKCRARKGHMTLLLCHSEPFDFAQDRLHRAISVLNLIARDLIRSLPARSTAGLPVYVTASPAAPFSTPLRFARNDTLLVQIDPQRRNRFRYFQSIRPSTAASLPSCDASSHRSHRLVMSNEKRRSRSTAASESSDYRCNSDLQGLIYISPSSRKVL